MTQRTKKNRPGISPSNESGKPYGYVLTLRALAGFAVDYPHHGAALRVLCVVAQYMNQEGVCRVSQDTVAARLGISRQAVNKQIHLLDELDVLFRDSTDGKLCEYTLARSQFEDERAGEENLQVRREIKKEQRAKARKEIAPSKVQPAQTGNVVALSAVRSALDEVEFG